MSRTPSSACAMPFALLGSPGLAAGCAAPGACGEFPGPCLFPTAYPHSVDHASLRAERVRRGADLTVDGIRYDCR